MKRGIYLILCGVVLGGASSGGSLNQIQQTLDQLKAALNGHHFETIVPYLAPDFSFDGHTGSMAQMIMQQIVTQYPATIDSIRIQKVEKLDRQLLLSVWFHSVDGRKTKEIILSDDFKIIQAPIVKIQLANHDTPQTRSPSVEDELPAKMVLPFELSGRLIVVQAEIEGVRGNFILDTGAAGFCLNARIFPHLQNQAQSVEHKVYGVGGKIQDVKWIEISDFRCQAIKLDTVKALYQDLSHLEENTGIQIVGLIGADFLRKFTVQFDYNRRELTLFSTNPEAYWQTAPNSVIDFRMIRHLPVIDAQIGDYTLHFGLDSGAEEGLMQVKWEAPLMPYLEFLQPGELNGADTNSQRVKKVKVDEFMIGDMAYQNHIFALANINWGHESEIDGLLGFEFLSGQKTAIDFQNQKLYFWHTPEF